MSQVFYHIPPFIEPIVERLAKRTWLVHNFNIESDNELYNPANYLYNTEFDRTNYVLTLDLNIYQFLLNIVKKKTPKDNFRDAASLLVFCQVTNIDIDPTYPVYEKVNYNRENLSEAVSDLELFHNINNGDMEDLAKYALEISDSVSINMSCDFDRKKTEINLMKYKKLKEWDSLYLMMLSIIDININTSIPRREKLGVFSDWMIYMFRRSLVAFVYAVVLFCGHPIKRMMKFKPTSSPDHKRKSVENMTWDLYIMSQFFKMWTEKNKNDEFLYASDDNAFCSLLRNAIQVQKEQGLAPIKHYMNESEYESAVKLLSANEKDRGRAYTSTEWGPDYRAKLIAEYDNVLYS
jgi:hypothetical protein